MAYKNKYCAACNHATALQKWGFMVEDCDDPFFDLNLYDSFNAIIQNAKGFKCNFLFRQPFEFRTTKCERNRISKCNVTGRWDTWNKDIDFACEHYDAPYRVFRNVFCYICNTGSSNIFNVTVNSCPSYVDQELKDKCAEEPTDNRTLPYKNSFCRECNMLPGVDVEYNKRVNVYYENPVLYEGSISLASFNVCKLRLHPLYDILALSTTVDTMCGAMQNISDRNNIQTKLNARLRIFVDEENIDLMKINLSALYERYKLFGGSAEWCTLPNVTHRQDIRLECSCRPDCFRSMSCCPDALVNSPVTCTRIGDQYSSVVIKCTEGFNDNVVKYLCERNTGDTMIDSIPFYNKYEGFDYKNLFCLMCNPPRQNDVVYWLNRVRTYTRDIHLSCGRYVDFENYLPRIHSHVRWGRCL